MLASKRNPFSPVFIQASRLRAEKNSLRCRKLIVWGYIFNKVSKICDCHKKSIGMPNHLCRFRNTLCFNLPTQRILSPGRDHLNEENIWLLDDNLQRRTYTELLARSIAYSYVSEYQKSDDYLKHRSFNGFSTANKNAPNFFSPR